MPSRKLIVTHRGALAGKYGRSAGSIFRALGDLVAADARRGIESRVVALDDEGEMRAFGGEPMGPPTDREGAKRAIDAAARATEDLHYLMIVGAPDVVPEQLLFNTAGAIGRLDAQQGADRDGWFLGDFDFNVPSDLPYASDAPFSDEIGDFQGPTRAVGRLPDMPGAKRPDVLLGLIDLAARATSLPRAAYDDYLALSAEIWRRSTRKTVARVFGGEPRLVLCPPHLKRWAAAKLRPRMHLINCHGGEKRGGYIGESDANVQYAAIRSDSIRGRISRGTVVAAECCFGAQVFNPRDAVQVADTGRMPMALEYLASGAHGLFGSSTTAYGQVSVNDYADDLCAYFLRHVREGASLGRAALEARLDYLRFSRWDDPVKLKTLAQFNLLGDPSIHPVASDGGRDRRAVRLPAAVVEGLRRERIARRKRIAERARTASRARNRLAFLGLNVSADDMRTVEAAAREHGMAQKLMRFFSLAADVAEAEAGVAGRVARRRANKVIVVMDEQYRELGGAPDREAGEVVPIRTFAGHVACLRDGELLTIKKIASR